ncbi:Oidioi.mRNA.OKI2018_I69.chr2.g5612.t1.cds [Oikopleura dioica]|uniref:Oidioi.mRNA.OKI2018_I69.chr2.g5612.t1.cds n=1 Tax=Oikopleura dioica TaxID=34765 RepID=A0ABN7T1D9_OIKDI|nr:Oidioi.mRNA.OKI2018_I69.chr2.g5612.t1.cds [Oikopleura dioica]
MTEAKEKYMLMDDMIAAGATAKSAMATVYSDLESMRPQLFRLASEANENNDELMAVLRLTDEVNRVINVVKDKYPNVVELSNSVPSSGLTATSSPDTQTSRLHDLGVDLNLLGLEDDPPSNRPAQSSGNVIDDLKTLNSIFGSSPMGEAPQPTLLDINPSAPSVSAMTSQASPQIAVWPTPPEVAALTGIKVNLADFQASSTTRTLVDDDGVRVILVRGENKIQDRSDVPVLLVTFDSTNPAPIENLMFNAKVAKPFRIKLLQPSGNEFPAFNPVSSTSSRITQLILVGGPLIPNQLAALCANT